MIVDTSAVPAVPLQGPDSGRRAGSIAAAPSRRMSVAKYLETAIVLEGRGGEAAGHELDVFPQEAGTGLEPVAPGHARAARRAWRRFGRGDRPAGPDLGDRLAHALASAAGGPLLFKGGDFGLADIDVA